MLAIYNGMTQASSVNIVAIKSRRKYANPCMSMRLGNARYSEPESDAAWRVTLAACDHP